LDFSPIAYDTPIQKRDSKMILSFLAAVRRRLDDGALLADFRRGFLSELHVLLRRVLFRRKLDHRLPTGSL